MYRETLYELNGTRDPEPRADPPGLASVIRRGIAVGMLVLLLTLMGLWGLFASL